MSGGLTGNDRAVSLEELIALNDEMAALVRAVSVALIYPIVVLAVAYGLFVLTVTHLTPVTRQAYENLTSSSDPLLASLVLLGSTAKWWAICPPLIAAVLIRSLQFYGSALK